MCPAAPDASDDGLLKRRVRVIEEVIERELDGKARPLRLASILAERYRWPRLRTLSDLWTMRAHGLI